MDVSDIVDYNFELVNRHRLTDSFFCLNRDDPTIGFPFNASSTPGFTFPVATGLPAGACAVEQDDLSDAEDLAWRLLLGSHLAIYLRHELDKQKGYTSTVGISTNKLLSKLVGNVNKPQQQTLLLPPYAVNANGASNVHTFIDGHDIGSIPGIGFKTALKLRSHVLGRPAQFDDGLVYGATRDKVSVRGVRLSDSMGPKLLQKILDGPGVPKDLPEKVWGLLNGVDNTEVSYARGVPRQISIEDSYLRLDGIHDVLNQLQLLSIALIKRLRLDLTTDAEESNDRGLGMLDEPVVSAGVPPRRWIAHPRLLRLSTRCRPPKQQDGSRQRSFARVSLSAGLPTFVFDLRARVEDLAARLVEETVRPLFSRQHPAKSGWDLSLINLCAANITMAASHGKDAAGRNIADMFRSLGDGNSKECMANCTSRRIPNNEPGENYSVQAGSRLQGNPKVYGVQKELGMGSEDEVLLSQESYNGESYNGESYNGESDEDGGPLGESCDACGALIPIFAILAHERYHATDD